MRNYPMGKLSELNLEGTINFLKEKKGSLATSKQWNYPQYIFYQNESDTFIRKYPSSQKEEIVSMENFPKDMVFEIFDGKIAMERYLERIR